MDPGRLGQGLPPFYRQPKGPEPDRGTLNFMIEQCGAIAFIAPRLQHPSPGVDVELDVLAQAAHPPFFRIKWPDQNERLIVEIPSFFDYLMPSRSPSPADFSLAGETCARLAWLACMMWQLKGCGEMGTDVHRQLARRHGLLNAIAATRAVKSSLEPNRLEPAVLAGSATDRTCLPVLESWLGGPSFRLGGW
jgi:hypothetical protein